jgi:hypothetical protein
VRFELYEAPNAGQVQIIYGSSAGLTSTRADQRLLQGSDGVDNVAEEGDHFGLALATGDLNGDGYADLAIGVPGENTNAGGAEVIYGSSTGLSATAVPDQFWTQDSLGMDSGEEAGDEFGFALTAGDLNRDGNDDLAVGVPKEDGDTAIDQGAVHVVYGTSGGLSATTKADQLWLHGHLGIDGLPQAADHLGWSVTSGDFNGDHYCDVAAGVPGEWVGGAVASGAVNVIYGSSGGLSATSDQLFDRSSPNIDGDPIADIQFGFAVAAGDFNGDGESDLAIGAPYDTVNNQVHAGSASVIYGAASGLSATLSRSDQLWSQESADVIGNAQIHDHFGYSLTAGNFIASFRIDGNERNPLLSLAIGVPGEDGDTGAVQVLYPWPGTGLDPDGLSEDQWWIQGADGVNGSRVVGDRFGAALG